jgi:hypothetical protein
VAEHDGLTFAPVLKIDFRAVFGCDRAHIISVVVIGFQNLKA